ncbi:MAG TPA: hypothetical protein VLL82_12850, partial [Mycobacterium sp.]|nr:hypothetical protein [Mycobacterium sp.]
EPVLRTMFDAFALTVSYDAKDRLATCEVVLDDDTLPTVADAVAALGATTPAGGLGISRARSGPDAQLGICVARSEGFEPPTF